MKLNIKYIFIYLLYLQRVQPSFLVCQGTRNDHSQAAGYQKHQRHRMSGLWHLSQSDAPTKNRQGCETGIVVPKYVGVNCEVGLHVGKLMRVMCMYLNYVMRKLVVNLKRVHVNREVHVHMGKLIRATG